MKKLLCFILFTYFSVQAQFIEFNDSCSKNRFLGNHLSMCKTETNDSADHYQKGYECGNGTISELLNVNLLSPALQGNIFYIFNDFMYWIHKDIRKGYNANLSPDSQFSGGGIFMIMIGTSPYLHELVAPHKSCPEGQSMVAAQLKYNNGSSLTTWSQDAICLAPTDKFKIQISDEKDTTAPPHITPATAEEMQKTMPSSAWNQESGPAAAVYEQAGSSPRKIKLIKQ